jgi:hypothetical protein
MVADLLAELRFAQTSKQSGAVAPAGKRRPLGAVANAVGESAECSVDLDGHRSASNLDELDLGEQAGAVA